MKSLRQQRDDSLINEPQGSRFHLPPLTSEASTDLSCWRTGVKTLVHIRREDSWVLLYIVPAYQNSLLCDFCSNQTDAVLYKRSKCQILTLTIVSSTTKMLLFFCFSPFFGLSRPLVIVSPKKIKNHLHYILSTSSSRNLKLLCAPPADDMDAVPVKHFIKHVMELYKNNLQGFSEEFEVISVPFY